MAANYFGAAVMALITVLLFVVGWHELLVSDTSVAGGAFMGMFLAGAVSGFFASDLDASRW